MWPSVEGAVIMEARSLPALPNSTAYPISAPTVTTRSTAFPRTLAAPNAGATSLHPPRVHEDSCGRATTPGSAGSEESVCWCRGVARQGRQYELADRGRGTVALHERNTHARWRTARTSLVYDAT